MTMLYPNMCYNEVCYKGTALDISYVKGEHYVLFQDSWLYHLTVAAGGGTGNVGTHYEQLIAKLMESGGDPSKYLKDLQHGSIVIF